MSGFSHAYPLILTPAYKDYLWGGQNILKTFNRSLDLKSCAESWEASDRDEGLSHVENGIHKGSSLKDLLRDHPMLFSEKKLNKFPLLIKLIDANKPLSIQVHPGEAMAQKYGGEAKSEMWHILEAKEGSKIYLGFKENLSESDVLEAIKSETLKHCLNAIDVRAGETYYIPGGLVHSIGEGCLIYEAQQNSNTTYRLYDWGRTDEKGLARDLHIEKAFEVMNKDQVYSYKSEGRSLFQEEGTRVDQLLDSPFFKFNRLVLESLFILHPRNICRIFFVSKGKILIRKDKETFSVARGGTFIVPAGCDALEFISAAEGTHAEILETIPV